MDRINRRPNHIEDVLGEMYAGDGKGGWYGWSDPMNRIYENIIIHDPAKEKPTQEFLDSELARLQSEFDAQAYARNRQAEYPSINDLIVALWENVVEERASAVVSLEAKRQAVKTKYPKG